MNRSIKHWGEIEPAPLPRRSTAETESLRQEIMSVIEHSMDKFCLAEYDIESDDDETTDHITLDVADPLVMYAISLHKYENDMNEMIRMAEIAIESHLIPPADAAPPIPEMPAVSLRHARNSLNYIPKDFTDFTEGKELTIPELSSAIVKQVLTKCVATLLAHIGFETTHQSILDFLTDVMIDFFKKIVENFKTAADDEAKGRISGFPNIAEKVLVEIGFGGVKGLHDYYQSRVVNYVYVLQRRCSDLNKYYQSLRDHVLKSEAGTSNRIDSKVILVKQEIGEMIDVDNAQVHLALDSEMGFSSLDAGFQLLSSLEASTSAADNDQEEGSITISPSVITLSETESSTSPYNKRRRTK